ncbi:hypothetical protein J4771_11370 [Candidatus Kaistella beijingensis]|uniref:DUF6759 domain-containing protein n=1 Tax=Candidatus Kaistella beijingensis TaxID=2820270 RepID=UPI001CC58C1C|nr:DUF6759 domain-containing protein [Candidatus Kaistella beijingensis]UBB89444.1 hypothetical protein J4771_11370 [Candidatus Kaistella beijingensis]
MPINYPVYGSTPSSSGSSASESREFSELWEKDQLNKKRETAEVLTYLLNDTDPKDKFTGAVITNESSCNIIVRLVAIKGEQIYNLPVQRNSKNQFKILKGSYTLKSKICNANYYTQKVISDPLILKLGVN